VGTGSGLRKVVHEVRGLSLGDETRFEAGHLSVSAEAAGALFESPALTSTRLSCAAPGDRTRIVKLLDAVEPRSKGPGGGGIFPGFLAPALPRGRGETHVLRGAAVIAAGYLPQAQEALVDMTGPAAPLSPLGATHNLVVEFEPEEGASWEAVEAALRAGLLRLAAALGEAALEAAPDAVEELPAGPCGPVAAGGRDGLPWVGTITNLQTQGAFKDVFVYGRSFAGCLPTSIDPLELEDGAVVSGQYGHPGLKNPTYLHQNHPVVAALRARDGSDLHFGGVILCPEPVDQASKDLVSVHAARLAAALRWDAAIVTKEGGGNADADAALKMDALEDLGIVAVGIFAEMSGPEGTAPPLVSPPLRASSMVSSGNYDERLALPEMQRALGGARLEVADAAATDALEVPTAVVYGSLSPLGWGKLTAGSDGRAGEAT
jgi:sarcosine reductase